LLIYKVSKACDMVVKNVTSVTSVTRREME
jgi:hypothetical protein